MTAQVVIWDVRAQPGATTADNLAIAEALGCITMAGEPGGAGDGDLRGQLPECGADRCVFGGGRHGKSDRISAAGGLSVADKETVREWMVEGHEILRGRVAGSIPARGAATITPGTTSQTIPAGVPEGGADHPGMQG